MFTTIFISKDVSIFYELKNILALEEIDSWIVSSVDEITKEPDLIIIKDDKNFENIVNRLKYKFSEILPIIVISDNPNYFNKIGSLHLGVNFFLNTPVKYIELLMIVKNILQLSRVYKENKKNEIISKVLISGIEAKDPYLKGHCERVADYSERLYLKLQGRNEEGLRQIRIGAILHDIGKISIPSKILTSSTKLTIEERKEVEKHPIIGYKLCRSELLNEVILDIIRHHHENLDGSGYPDGIKNIRFETRIVSIVDRFDALTSNRSYRPALTRFEAINILQKECENNKIDCYILDIFKNL